MKMSTPFGELKASRDQLLSMCSNGDIPEDFHDKYTEAMDQYFRRALQESGTGRGLFRLKRPFALIAVGGYGRRELCLHSDIDIMILFGAGIPQQAKELSREFFFPLWDLGLEVGYAIRDIRDCLSLSNNDFEVLTSMMDARFICGDSPLYLSLVEKLRSEVLSKKSTAFARWLDERDQIRTRIHGDASSLLEPHLKEGSGGLRDYHHMLWLAKAFFNLRIPRDLEYSGKLSHNEYQQLMGHLRLIWLVRNHLHALSERKNDKLTFEHQEKIAARLGFRDRKDFKAVEQFLGKLHTSMLSIKSLHRAFTKEHLPHRRAIREAPAYGLIPEGIHIDDEELTYDSATTIISRPLLLMEIFEASAHLGRAISLEAIRLTREFLYLVDDNFRNSPKAVRSFLNIIGGEHGVEALEQMFETGLLDAFIPEFAQIKDRVQFDTYHIYPVGKHCLEAVRFLKTLGAMKEILFLDIFTDLAEPETLLLSALFHDIGKVGRRHAERGAVITQEILRRFGYADKPAEDILFLVRHHLLLVENATRRDLNDEKAVVQCARTIGDVERLKMLYLLTWADSKATGPRAWTDWIANLVQELFFKILHILEQGELATPQASRKLERVKSQVFHSMKERMDHSTLEALFEAMSPRYLLNTPTSDILQHLEMVTTLNKCKDEQEPESFYLSSKKDDVGGCWKLTFIAKDRPGLFSDMAGVLALNNVNILAADVYTWKDGTAVDILRVSSPPDPIHPHETWKRIERDLENTFKGNMCLSHRLKEKSRPSIFAASYPAPRPPQVNVDNDSSDFFTLIEVFAHDRAGLLYLITKALFDLRLDIRIAKIATKADQIADVFYVRDLEGQKVVDPEQIVKIKETILHQLTQS